MNNFATALSKKHPNLLNNCICGIYVPHGWESIVTKLCEDVDQYLEKKESEHPDEIVSVEVLQIKEKFARLCFYYRGGDENIRTMVTKAEKKSTTTCQTCGEIGEVTFKNGWMSVRCEKHRQFKEKE